MNQWRISLRNYGGLPPNIKIDKKRLFRNAYLNSLKCVVENGCKSIAFPLISNGIYGLPERGGAGGGGDLGDPGILVEQG